jgi:hypothetical protein
VTLVYRDPTLLASTLAPLVDLATKVVQLQYYKIDPESTLHAALKAAEERIAQCIGEYLEVKAQSPDSIEGDAVQTFKVGDRVRVARKVAVEGWVEEMDGTIGCEGEISRIDEPQTDDIPICVRFSEDGFCVFFYPPSALEKVSDHTPTDESK